MERHESMIRIIGLISNTYKYYIHVTLVHYKTFRNLIKLM